MVNKRIMGEILVDIIKSRRGLVGRTAKGEEIKLSLPSPEVGLLGKLPKEIKVGTPQYDDYVNRMINEKILDSPPYPPYIRLGAISIILEEGGIIFPYDSYIRDD